MLKKKQQKTKKQNHHKTSCKLELIWGKAEHMVPLQWAWLDRIVLWLAHNLTLQLRLHVIRKAKPGRKLTNTVTALEVVGWRPNKKQKTVKLKLS